MARNRIYYAVALVAAALCYVLYEKWFSWFFLTAVLLAPILSVLLSIPTALRLRVELQCPETVQRGREAVGHLQLAGSFLRPACVVRLNIRSFLAGEQTERRLRLTSANALQLLLPTEHCDVLELSVKKVRIYDFLGLFTLPQRPRLSHGAAPATGPGAQAGHLPPGTPAPAAHGPGNLCRGS